MENEELYRLFERVRGGDKQAFSELYHDLKAPVYTVICRIVRDRHLAEDVMQEVFLKLYRDPPDPSVQNVRAWIFQTARNRAIDTLRKKKPEDELSEQPDSTVYFEDSVALLVDIGRAMEQLSLDERQIVSLHLTAGLTFREVSDIMSLSPAAAFRLYRKAIHRLRNELNGGSL